jgi:hypothetical protein
MADHFYSVVLGDESPDGVTVGTSTSSEIIELRVHDGDGTTTLDVVKALEVLENYFATQNAPA